MQVDPDPIYLEQPFFYFFLFWTLIDIEDVKVFFSSASLPRPRCVLQLSPPHTRQEERQYIVSVWSLPLVGMFCDVTMSGVSLQEVMFSYRSWEIYPVLPICLWSTHSFFSTFRIGVSGQGTLPTCTSLAERTSYVMSWRAAVRNKWDDVWTVPSFMPGTGKRYNIEQLLLFS